MKAKHQTPACFNLFRAKTLSGPTKICKMDTSSSPSTAFHHARSNSLPSRPHPVISQLQENLNRLRSPEATGSSSSPSVTGKINGLQDLQECVDQLLLLPHMQQAFTHDCYAVGSKSYWTVLSGSWTCVAPLRTTWCRQGKPCRNFSRACAEEK